MKKSFTERSYGIVNSRRDFLIKSSVAVFGGISGLSLLSSCNNDSEDITPPEDLMREHGVLNRVLLVYDHFLGLMAKNQTVDPDMLGAAAGIIKTFIEDYHEKQEEDFLFPRFEKANKLTDLVKVLRAQHAAGRLITAGLLQMGKQAGIQDNADKQKLTGLLFSFINMYRPHEAREDTILFPAIRSIVSKQEFASLGDDFEKREHLLFGKGGFEVFVDKVQSIEQQLGIYDLAQFTPNT
jgi:hemerythrin-like domain-containing protein